MHLAKVRGTVVSTCKDPSLQGVKLLVVELLNESGNSLEEYEVAADVVGAGIGEWVLISRGSGARQQERHLNKPVDAAVIAIIDTVSLDTGMLYDKREDFR